MLTRLMKWMIKAHTYNKCGALSVEHADKPSDSKICITSMFMLSTNSPTTEQTILETEGIPYLEKANFRYNNFRYNNFS